MLIDKEKKILDIIKQYQSENGYSPTFEAIAKMLGIRSTSTIHRYISALKQKGYIYIPEKKRKVIEVVQQTKDYCLPLVGTIAAGKPLEAYEVIENVDMLPIVKAKDRYLLKISGDSMKDSGILDGDLVLIQKQNVAREGQIVVALIDQTEATLKEFRMQHSSLVTLIPHNEALQPMMYAADRISIQGIYLGLRFDKSCLN